VARQAADADPGGDDALDGLVAAELELGARRADPVEPAVARFPGAGAGLAQDPGRRRELGVADPAAGERMAGCGEGDELVGQPAADDEVRMALPTLDETDVDVEPDHRLDHLAGVADHEPRCRLRVLLLPSRDQPGQQVLADREARRDAQRRRRLAREQRLQLAGLVEQRDRQREEGAAVLVDDQAAADTVEERRAEGALERRQGGARGRLRAGDPVGRGARRAGPRQGGEHLELAKRHAQPRLIGFIAHGERDYPLFRSVWLS
jgi:hypothetical protein